LRSIGKDASSVSTALYVLFFLVAKRAGKANEVSLRNDNNVHLPSPASSPLLFSLAEPKRPASALPVDPLPPFFLPVLEHDLDGDEEAGAGGEEEETTCYVET
jgi:hypothetical protein